MGNDTDHDVVIVGAGFAGLFALYRARQLGLRATVLEKGPSVGGTWFWNTYPGARCDVESIDYSYSFSEELQQEWEWTERYATQPELLRYIDHVADRFDLRRDVQLDTALTSAVWGEENNSWTLTTSAGATISTRYTILASGPLSAIKDPDIPGLDTFEGTWVHSARWPGDGLDLASKRVGIVGTGSTGIQLIPVVAQEAAHLTVFQRTPNFTVPARNRPLAPGEMDEVKATYADRRRRGRETPSGVPADRIPFSGLGRTAEQHREHLEIGWGIGGGNGLLRSYSDILTSQEVNDIVADFVRDKIRATVSDPETAELLVPRDLPIGAKRLCVGSNYYETYNRDNVELVDVSKTPLEKLTATGVVVDGVEHELDVLIFAIGFDAITGAVGEIDIRGRGGRVLRDDWKDGPQTFLGLAVNGFPNLFLVNGPGSPAVLGNVMAFIEHHIKWITDCIAELERSDRTSIEATATAMKEWSDVVETAASRTLYPKANSWFVGANIPGKPRRFLPFAGGFNKYQEYCAEVEQNGYRGFEIVDAHTKVTAG